MALRYRPMRLKDVPECVEIVGAHPLLASQYGNAIRDLPSVWLGLLGREAFRPVVFEETGDSGVPIAGVGVSAFVSEDFLTELKTPPSFWIGPELTKRILRGDSPLLSDKQVRHANAHGGLNLVTWVAAYAAAHLLDSAEGLAMMLTTYVEEHRGFLLKEVATHAMSLETLEAVIRSGGFLLNPVNGRYVDSLDKCLHEVFAAPHLLGMTRELAMARPGTWISSLFVYQSPRFSFRPSEQRLLLAALQGGTDEDIAATLGISLSAVKKTWRSIYDRVTNRRPGLISDRVPEEMTSERGKEKKQRLLAYVREHPEELRPAII